MFSIGIKPNQRKDEPYYARPFRQKLKNWSNPRSRRCLGKLVVMCKNAFETETGARLGDVWWKKPEVNNPARPSL
jgi:hypothetical protein